jgi:hypothetical protein
MLRGGARTVDPRAQPAVLLRRVLQHPLPICGTPRLIHRLATVQPQLLGPIRISGIAPGRLLRTAFLI